MNVFRRHYVSFMFIVNIPYSMKHYFIYWAYQVDQKVQFAVKYYVNTISYKKFTPS